MSDVLAELLDLLTLETIEENLFRGASRDPGWGTVFGGHVLGQALAAATMTVPEERVVHSLHSYFLRPGAVDRPIVYQVDRIRDGRSFTTRRVVAIQGGRPIFNMSASFQIAEPGYAHQDDMPDEPGPDGLLSERELAQKVAKHIPPAFLKRALAERPIESRPVKPLNPLKPDARPPHRAVWYKAASDLPDDPALHRYLLAYVSDYNLLTTAMLPHAVTWLTPGMQVASLDHSMWFHRPFRMDEWLLHVADSGSASGARGLVRGRFYTREGQLVASTAQEGLMRNRQWPADGAEDS